MAKDGMTLVARGGSEVFQVLRDVWEGRTEITPKESKAGKEKLVKGVSQVPVEKSKVEAPAGGNWLEEARKIQQIIEEVNR